MDYQHLAVKIKNWAQELGFAAAGIADTDLTGAEDRLLEWLAAGYHGESLGSDGFLSKWKSCAGM